MQAINGQLRRVPQGAPVYYDRYCPKQTKLYRLILTHLGLQARAPPRASARGSHLQAVCVLRGPAAPELLRAEV